MSGPRTLILALLVALVAGGIAPAAAAPREQALEQLRAVTATTMAARARQARSGLVGRPRLAAIASALAPPVDAFVVEAPERSELAASVFACPREQPPAATIATRSRAPPR